MAWMMQVRDPVHQCTVPCTFPDDQQAGCDPPHAVNKQENSCTIVSFNLLCKLVPCTSLAAQIESRHLYTLHIYLHVRTSSKYVIKLQYAGKE